MSQATVYKTLALLKEMNQVLEIDLRDDSHYDGNRPSSPSPFDLHAMQQDRGWRSGT